MTGTSGKISLTRVASRYFQLTTPVGQVITADIPGAQDALVTHIVFAALNTAGPIPSTSGKITSLEIKSAALDTNVNSGTPPPSAVVFTGSNDPNPAQGNATQVVTLSPGGIQISGGSTTIPDTMATATSIWPYQEYTINQVQNSDFTVTLEMDPAGTDLPDSPDNVNFTSYGLGIQMNYDPTTAISFGWIGGTTGSPGQFPFLYATTDTGATNQFVADFDPAANATGTSRRLSVTRIGDVFYLTESERGVIGSITFPQPDASATKFTLFVTAAGAPMPATSGKIKRIELASSAMTTDMNGGLTEPGGALFTDDSDVIVAQGNATHVLTVSPTGLQISGGEPVLNNIVPQLTNMGPEYLASQLGSSDFTFSIDLDPASTGLPTPGGGLYTSYSVVFVMDTAVLAAGWINVGAGGLSPFLYNGANGQFVYTANAQGTAARLTVERVGGVASLIDSRFGPIGSVSFPDDATVSTIGVSGYTGAGAIPGTSGLFNRFALISPGLTTDVNFDPAIPTPTPIPTPPPTPTPTPVPDTTPPSFVSAPFVVAVSNNSATITWVTDESSDSEIDYGTVSGSLSLNASSGVLTTDHSLTITGLTPATTYFFRASSTDIDSNGPTTSAEAAFLTNSIADTTNPIFVGQPDVSPITTSSAIVNWETDEPSTSVVRYGTTVSLGSQTSLPGLVSSHSVQLTGLASNTTYFYALRSTDASGNTADSPTRSFSTTSVPDTTPPVIVQGPGYGAVRDTTVYVGWTTSEPADSLIVYNDGANTHQLANGRLEIGHLYQLTGLTPDTIYTVTVSSMDASGNGPVTSAPFTIRTSATPDTSPPVITEGPLVLTTTDSEAFIYWLTDEEASTTVFFNLASDPSSIFSVFDAVHDPSPTTTHNAHIAGLTVDTRYKYVAISVDSAGFEKVSSQRTFRTLPAQDATPPVYLTDPELVGSTDTTASFFWITDEPSTTRVVYGTNPPGALDQVLNDPNLVTVHRATVVGLTPGETYGFDFSSTDSAGNTATFNSTPPGAGPGGALTPIFSITTSLDPDTEAPTITVGPQVVALSDTSATIRWVTEEIADSRVSFRLSTDLATGPEISDLNRDFEHVIVLTGLTPSTAYFFNASSVDVAGNRFNAPQGAFTTTAGPDATAPVIAPAPSVSDLTTNRAKISWGTDEFATSRVEYGLTTGNLNREASPTGRRDDHEVTLTNLQSGTVYYFRAFSVDASGNEVQGPLQSLITNGSQNSAKSWELYD